ncbi:heavy-metal-associated domain-containing protein [Aquabacterium sp.]|uniref:heavy-metal-associated domain-containing protein n=1 Tax=Aquabacterium sp. TaxID=1872578 RepID=UPI0035AEAEEE
MTTPDEHVFQVKGMSCGHCVRAVTQAVQGRDPQARVEVDLPTGRVTVQTALSRAAAAEAIAEEGYEVAA